MWRWDQQEPFGNNPADENPSGLGAFDLPLRLPGQYFDKETNLHYNYFRDYDPSLGIYKQSDLIGLSGGINTYAYALSAPTRFSDPMGLAVTVYCRPAVFDGSGRFHCFVNVTCPAEGWSKTFSMFANWHLRSGYKSLNDEEDSIKKAISYGSVQPRSCMPDECGYEKQVDRRFAAFPSGNVFYRPLGPNSNSFVNGLLMGNLPAGVPTSIAPGITYPHPAFTQ